MSDKRRDSQIVGRQAIIARHETVIASDDGLVAPPASHRMAMAISSSWQVFNFLRYSCVHLFLSFFLFSFFSLSFFFFQESLVKSHVNEFSSRRFSGCAYFPQTFLWDLVSFPSSILFYGHLEEKLTGGRHTMNP